MVFSEASIVCDCHVTTGVETNDWPVPAEV